MASSVTLPGGGIVKYTLPVGSDASTALTAAIKSEFAAAAKGNITMNVVGSGTAGKTGFFNAVLNKSGTANKMLTAGSGVQAIIDLGTGKDTITAGVSTNLIYGNGSASATKGDAFILTGNKLPTTVFGTAGSDTLALTNGSAVAYLEGGKNTIALSGASDTISLPGTDADTVVVGASTKASIVGGAGALTVNLSTGASTIVGGSGTLSVTGGVGNATIIGGSGNISVTGGLGTLNFSHGKGGNDTVNITNNSKTDTLGGALGAKGTDHFNISLTAGGKYIINSFSTTADTIKIVGASQAQITAALKGAHATTKGGVTTTTLTIGKGSITVVGGAVTAKNFTH